MPVFISRTALAERRGVSSRTIQRRQLDPEFPRSTVIRGRHFFLVEQVEQYERGAAGAAACARPFPSRSEVA